MEPAVGIGGSFAWALWFLGELTFKWVPGATISLVGTGVPGAVGDNGLGAPIMYPITPHDVVQYLQTVSSPGTYNTLYYRWDIFVAISLIISLLLMTLIVYCVTRIFQVRRMERLKFEAAAHTVTARDVPQTQLRWNRILEEAHSDSDQKWRLAILEADIMLSELLDVLGYRGDTLADKLRDVDRAHFQAVDIAWEAHKIRNKIAHEGAAHLLNAREARRVIGLYERIFKEFKFIE
jgi:hypothetical protein